NVSHILRRHRRASAKHTANSCFPQIDFLAERFEQLRCRKQSRNLAMLQYRHTLIDDVIHISTRDIELLLRNNLLHPTRIEIDEVTGTATKVRQMLDGQTQTTRTSRPNHQPRSTTRKMFIRNFPGKLLVIDLVIIPADALFGHAGGATSFENIEGSTF